jgi:hypothetical protein
MENPIVLATLPFRYRTTLYAPTGHLRGSERVAFTVVATARCKVNVFSAIL